MRRLYPNLGPGARAIAGLVEAPGKTAMRRNAWTPKPRLAAITTRPPARALNPLNNRPRNAPA